MNHTSDRTVGRLADVTGRKLFNQPVLPTNSQGEHFTATTPFTPARSQHTDAHTHAHTHPHSLTHLAPSACQNHQSRSHDTGVGPAKRPTNEGYPGNSAV